MADSILTTTKKILGIDDAYDVFDVDVITHINSAFSTLHQLGVGPTAGFAIEDASALWVDFINDDRMNSVRTYVYLRVRMLFDPPTTSYLVDALNEQRKELEWRLNVTRENDEWTSPTMTP